METVQGYVILKAATFETGHGFALGHNPGAPSPFVTWQFTEGENGHRDYYWGRYGTSQAWAQRDFDRRVDDYQQLYHAAVRHICDMEWTGEAIGNIVKNALDHTQAGGIVRITWERTPAMFRIFISDNGNGIVPEDIYHIFKRFYRSKHSLDTQGIGLGLPLAKSIIEGQNGVISVQSEVGKGTLFTLSFLTDL